MTRTLPRHARIYQNGYDLSCETRSIGPGEWTADFTNERGLCWEIEGGLLGAERIALGQVNTILNWDAIAANSPHDWIKDMDGDAVNIMVPVGLGAAPAAGDPCYMLRQLQRASAVVPGDSGMVTTTIDYEPGVGLMTYAQPWGTLIHAKAARTAANSAIGIDQLAATTYGGWWMVQVFSVVGAGTFTLKLQDAAVNADGSFADVATLTTGAIAHGSVPYSTVIALGATATVRRYLRWQLSLVGITSITFAMSFVRGRA